MNFQDVIEIVESAVYKAKGRRLTDPELTVLRGSWEGLTYEKMAEGSPYKSNYLKGDVSHKFWKLLSEALGEEVSRNFRAALQRALLSHNLTQTIGLGGDDINFVGESTLSKLQTQPDSFEHEVSLSSQSSYLSTQGTDSSQFSKQVSHLEKKNESLV